MPRPTAASARRPEYDSAAAVVGSDRALALNVEMASSKVKSWEACNRFVAHFNAFTSIAIVSNLVPCIIIFSFQLDSPKKRKTRRKKRPWGVTARGAFKTATRAETRAGFYAHYSPDLCVVVARSRCAHATRR